MLKKKSVKKQITLNELARMMAKGFGETASKKELELVKQDVSVLKQDVSGLKQDVTGIKAQMVTKSYLDDKLADLEGSLITRQRKEDNKVNLLIELLGKRKVLAKTDTKMLNEIQVFPLLYRKN